MPSDGTLAPESIPASGDCEPPSAAVNAAPKRQVPPGLHVHVLPEQEQSPEQSPLAVAVRESEPQPQVARTPSKAAPKTGTVDVWNRFIKSPSFAGRDVNVGTGIDSCNVATLDERLVSRIESPTMLAQLRRSAAVPLHACQLFGAPLQIQAPIRSMSAFGRLVPIFGICDP